MLSRASTSPPCCPHSSRARHIPPLNVAATVKLRRSWVTTDPGKRNCKRRLTTSKVGPRHAISIDLCGLNRKCKSLSSAGTNLYLPPPPTFTPPPPPSQPVVIHDH